MITARLFFYFPGSNRCGRLKGCCRCVCRDLRVSQYTVTADSTANGYNVSDNDWTYEICALCLWDWTGWRLELGSWLGLRQEENYLFEKKARLALPPSFISQCWELASVTNVVFVISDFFCAAELCNMKVLIMQMLLVWIYRSAFKTVFWYSAISLVHLMKLESKYQLHMIQRNY